MARHYGLDREYLSPFIEATGEIVGGNVISHDPKLEEGAFVAVLEIDAYRALSSSQRTVLCVSVSEADGADIVTAEILLERLDQYR